MERVYAFIDESGAFGWELDNINVSTHFIITAIIVKESAVDHLRTEAELLRKKHFQTGEIKSSNIGKNQNRRKRILADFLSLPFNIFSIVFDKRKLHSMYGLNYKTSFYKFLNNIVHKELRRAFKKITIVADEIGGSDYMQSFSKYVQQKQDIPTFFCEADFQFENSKSDVLIQVADLISGTLGYMYDEHKKSDKVPNYLKMLNKKIIRIQFYPKTFGTYCLTDSALSEEYDKDIAELCLKQAVIFINKYQNEDDERRKVQIIVLEYLLFRFMNNDLRKYIPTKEIMHQLDYMGIEKIPVQSFRTKIIGNLRDNDVIISSSSKGYKIPSKLTELFDFINHGTSIIIPMLERLKKCRDLVKLGTANELDLFDHTEYSSLKKYFDQYD